MARKAGMAFNTMLCLMGVAVGVVGLAFMLNESRPELTQRDLLWGSLGVALVLVLTGILGMVFCTHSLTDPSTGATNTNNTTRQRSAYKCYIALAFLLAVSMGAVLRYTAVTLRPDTVRHHLSRLWDRIPDDTALAIEGMGECCGFASYRDRIQEPCIRRQQERGCADVMVAYYRGSIRRLVPIVWMVLVSCLVAVASGVALWLWGEQECAYRVPVEDAAVKEPFTTSSKDDHGAQDVFNLPGTPKGQSFDDWHRTIFQ